MLVCVKDFLCVKVFFALTKGKEGKPLDLCIVRVAMPSADGFIATEYFYGTASSAAAYQKMIFNAGCPVPVECDFDWAKDFDNKTVPKLKNMLVIKG